MFEFTPRFDAKNFKSFAKNMQSSISNLKPVFDEFGRYIEAETKQQFDREVNPEGEKWTELSPRTLLRKKTTTILRETGAMSSSFYFVSTKSSFEYGLKDKKYFYHHYGTSKMPARVVVGISDERRIRFNKSLILYLKRVRNRR